MRAPDQDAVVAPPRGFRDILPTEARELRAIERVLSETFTSYGYVPIEPPMVERVAPDATLERHGLIQFLDRDGSLVALRPDITTAVARLVAQRYRDAAGALRLSYFAPVFREEPAMLGAEREYDQAGVELVGPSGTLADAEVLALLAESLARCGLRDATIEVGHVGVVRRAFAALRDDDSAAVMDALRAGDHVGAFRHAADAGMRGDALVRARAALAARGREIENVDIDGVDELREVIHLARDLFAGEPLWGIPNLSLVPALPYYTGVVFEALHPNSGFPIAAGGRYDLLLGAFGTPRRATGFAISVPRLHLALFASGWRPARERALVSLAPAGPRETAELAARLRGRGAVVAIGAVAERAGLEVVEATVVDRDRVRLADGRVVAVDQLARELG
ncbi:MAG TPA: ATP phosphoribosyltransferase regulatory subunit [Candidatus Limnocylindria bacterium]|jgi:ATP phosphoribosyltransferase regulatory subunit|nr:ATP phosphoribosyltransferase regulatory subunit [Candidatus Limnocylindria bacterium]